MSISINPIFNQALTNANNNKNIDNSLSKDYNKATDEELMSACKQFETYFLEQIFKGMKNTVIKADEGSNNQYVEYFEGMQYEKYATDATENGGIGLAKMLYESMKRTNDIKST